MVSWMSLWTVGRRGRAVSGAEETSMWWARDGLLPVSPVAGSAAVVDDGDMDAPVLGLSCSLALLLRWRTIGERLRGMYG